MKRIIFWLVAGFIITTPSLFAQDGNAAHERIETAKIGFITNRLNLTSDQAPKFWPLYNEYNTQRQEIKKSLKKLRTSTASMTTSDKDILNELKEMLNLRQKEVDLEKEYMNKFLKVINARQLAELYKTEQDFRQELLKTLRDRRSTAKTTN